VPRGDWVRTGEALPLFLPALSFVTSADQNYGPGHDFIVLSFVWSLFPFFLCNFLGAQYIFLGQAWAEGKGACNVPAPRGQRTGKTDT